MKTKIVEDKKITGLKLRLNLSGAFGIQRVNKGLSWN